MVVRHLEDNQIDDLLKDFLEKSQNSVEEPTINDFIYTEREEQGWKATEPNFTKRIYTTLPTKRRLRVTLRNNIYIGLLPKVTNYTIWRSNKMKTSRLVLAFAILMVALSVVVVAHAQAAQTSYTLNLSYFTVQMTYPSQVNPSDLVTVNIQANAKNSFTSASLTAQIFYVDGNSLHQLTSVALNNNGYVNSGSALNKQVTFTVPQNAPRTSLFVSITESVQTAYANYYYYPANYNYSSPYCYYDVYCGYGYTYYPYSSSYYAYPSYSYSTATDSGVAPLSYIKAQTPEYTALQSQYQTAEQQLNQTQAQNRQLQQQLQTAQNTIANLNQQLNAIQTMNTTLEAAAGGLGILAIVFGAFAIHYRGKSKSQTQASNIQTHQSKTK